MVNKQEEVCDHNLHDDVTERKPTHFLLRKRESQRAGLYTQLIALAINACLSILWQKGQWKMSDSANYIRGGRAGELINMEMPCLEAD